MDSQLKSDATYALALFNEKVSELNSARFTESLRAGKTRWRMSWKRGDGVSVERDLPHVEEIKAYVLTFRLFLQKSEEFSFWRLRSLYPKLEVSADLQAEAAEIIERVNVYLDGMSTIVMNSAQVTRRHVLEVVLHGGMVHANNRTNKDIMDYWASRPDLHIILEGRFVELLTDLTQFIMDLQQVNLKALKELATQTA